MSSVVAMALGVLGGVSSHAQPAEPQRTHLPLIGGDGYDSALMIQNVDLAATADIEVDFFDESRGFLESLNLPDVDPRTGRVVYMPATTLDRARVSAIAGSEVSVASIVRTEKPLAKAAWIYANPQPSRHIVSPVFTHNWFGSSASVFVQNSNRDESATATVTLKSPRSQLTRVVTVSIPPGAAVDVTEPLELSNRDGPILGSLDIESSEEITLVSVTGVRSEAEYAFEGVPADRASRRLFSPLFRARQLVAQGNPASGLIDTGIAVFNAGDQPADVSIEYRGAGGSCAGQTFRGPTVSIEPGTSEVYYQGDNITENLPVNCFGAAVIESNGPPILAVVNESLNEGETAAAFTAFSESDASQTLALPLYRFNHFGFTTGIAVMNLGSAEGVVTLEVFDSTGKRLDCNRGCSRSVGVHETTVYWPPSISSNSGGFYGSAILTSTQPVVAIVNDVHLTTGGTDSSTYSGIPLR